MNTRANERLTTMSGKVEAVDAITPKTQTRRIGRGRQVLSVLAASTMLAACGPDSSPDASGKPSTGEQTSSVSPSTSISPSPSAEVSPVTNIPTAFEEGPIWSDSRDILGKTTDVVVVTDDPDASVVGRERETMDVAGLSVETGQEVWSVSAKDVPEGLDGASYAGARFLGESVLMAWTGTADSGTLEASDKVTKLVFYNPETGEEITTRTVEGSDGLGKAVGLNGVRAGRGQVFTANGDELKFVQEGYGGPLPVAIHEDGFISGPIDSQFTTLSKDYDPDLPGELEREVDLGVRDDRTVRFLVMEDGAQNYKRYYQVFDTAEMKPVAAAEACDDATTGSDSAITSPNGEYVSTSQAVINLETGDVRCLGDLSDSLDVTAVTLADDGSLYGVAGKDRLFSLEAGESAKPEELGEDVNIPLAVFEDHVIFAADDDGITAYKRP